MSLSVRSHRRRLGGLLFAAGAVVAAAAWAPAPDARDTLPTTIIGDTGGISLRAVLAERRLYVMRGFDTVKVYDVAIGAPEFPTPTGAFSVRKIIWNPGWTPPPDAEWARNQKPRDPTDPRNPMKTAKIFFQEPDYYIHGTGDVASMGSAASHGCLRMRPDDVATLASELMTASGIRHDWDWVKRTLHLGRTRVVNLGRAIPLTVEEGIALPDAPAPIATDVLVRP